MKRLIKLFVLLLGLAATNFCAGCATVKTSNAAICRVQFDYADAGLEGLNLQNLRALAAFKEVCNAEH